MDTNCWICGGRRDSQEHEWKRSDITDYFGPVTTKTLLYKQTETRLNNCIISSKSEKLMSKAPICRRCNNERTQPYDYAWQTLSRYLQAHWAHIVTKGYFSLREVFPSNTRMQAVHVHLYFVKALGCRIVEEKKPLNIGRFSEALLSGKPHKDVFLTFANLPPLEEHLGNKYAVSSEVSTGNYSCGL